MLFPLILIMMEIYMLLIKIQWKESMKIIKLNDCLVMTL